MKAIFHGTVLEGKLKLDDRSVFDALVRTFEGKRVTISVAKVRQVRSLPANSYYWGVVIPLLSEHTGYEREEMHDALKWKFLKVHGEHFETVKSTADLDTAQFYEYVEQCRRLAAELGVVIPDPGEAA